MSTTQPLKKKDDIKEIKEYFVSKNEIRNYALFTLGINTSMRISDLLNLCWDDVYFFKAGRYRQHIRVVEQKTGKLTVIPLNCEVIKALEMLKEQAGMINGQEYLFKGMLGGNKPLSRTQAYRIIKKVAQHLNIEENISCHSLRKTFGYQAWKNGTPPAVIMSIYNHSSIEITKRYLSIDQEDKDAVFMGLNL